MRKKSIRGKRRKKAGEELMWEKKETGRWKRNDPGCPLDVAASRLRCGLNVHLQTDFKSRTFSSSLYFSRLISYSLRYVLLPLFFVFYKHIIQTLFHQVISSRSRSTENSRRSRYKEKNTQQTHTSTYKKQSDISKKST